MDRVHEMEVLVAIADVGSFAAAGRRLHISPPAVTRAVASLEARLGVRLLNRTTRSLSMTEAGVRFLETARSVLAGIEAAEKEALGEMAAPQGRLTVTTSFTFGRTALAPIVSEFLGAHPQVSLSVLLIDRTVNLVEEGIDVAVRIGPLSDSSLIARRVGQVRRLLVASPKYLDRRGWPQNPSDLKLHSIIAFTGLVANRKWGYLDRGGVAYQSFEPRLEINDAATAIAAATAGDGITVALSYMVAEQLRSGALVPVLEPVTPPPVPVHLVHPHNRLVAPKVRAFIDFAAPKLSRRLQELAIDPLGEMPDAEAPG